MKNARTVLAVVFPAIALLVGLSLIRMPAVAQNPSSDRAVAAQQDSTQPSGNQNSASKEETFTGKIVKNGEKLVLSNTEGKVTYQLDDQQKAQEYLNQNVKVVGVLDSSTGTIRVSAIEPA